LHLLAIL